MLPDRKEWSLQFPAMGHKYTKEQILHGASDAALECGLSQLTFGRLAKRMGISDRVVVYYFPTKNDLVAAVLFQLGAGLQEKLAVVFGTPLADYLAIAHTAWPVLACPDTDPAFALFFEANGLAAAGVEPYAELVRELVVAWVDWLATFIEGTAEYRRTEAETALALLDGLLLVRHLASPRAANRAATRLGVR